MTSGPEIDVDGIEDGEERESPRNAVDDCFLALREELIYDSTEKKNMNKRPLYNKLLDAAELGMWDFYQMRNAQGAGVMYVSFP